MPDNNVPHAVSGNNEGVNLSLKGQPYSILDVVQPNRDAQTQSKPDQEPSLQRAIQDRDAEVAQRLRAQEEEAVPDLTVAREKIELEKILEDILSSGPAGRRLSEFQHACANRGIHAESYQVRGRKGIVYRYNGSTYDGRDLRGIRYTLEGMELAIDQEEMRQPSTGNSGNALSLGSIIPVGDLAIQSADPDQRHALKQDPFGPFMFFRMEPDGSYFWRTNGKKAFHDHGESITFEDSNQVAVRAAMSLAKSKGWDTVMVSGTDEFRRSAWLEATLNGLNVVGYEPTQKDKKELQTARNIYAHLKESMDDDRLESIRTVPPQSPAR